MRDSTRRSDPVPMILLAIFLLAAFTSLLITEFTLISHGRRIEALEQRTATQPEHKETP